MARAPANLRAATKPALMRTMIRSANLILPILKSMRWMIVEASKPVLLTGDSPAVTVSGTGDVTYDPLLLPELHEVYLPITPEKLLIMTPFRELSQTTLLTSELARIVNEAIIRGCADVVIRHPDMDWPSNLTLPRTRIASPQPTARIMPNVGQPVPTLSWPQIEDQVLQDAMKILGGNPDATWPKM